MIPLQDAPEKNVTDQDVVDYEKFRSTSYHGEIESFDPANYFGKLYYEKYDNTKTYSERDFIKDIGYGDKLYNYVLNVVNGNKYVTIEENITNEDIKLLAPFCQCRYHLMAWYNPVKYITCRCCCGCIDSVFPSTSVINDTRDYLKSSTESLMSYP